MTDEKDSTKMAEDLVDAIDDEAGSDDVEDGLTKRERGIEASRVTERERKAEELRKQLRKRSLGMLNYRWAAGSLIIGGILAIISNFMQAMTRGAIVPPEVGFNTFWEGFLQYGGLYFILPIISGAFMIILAYFAYTTPKYTWLALIPGMILAMAGLFVYFLITFAVTYQPELTDELYAAFAPILMIVAAVFNLVAIALKERE
ncbi:hypothetical protein EU528_04610 [Candidatus Thorarchaeota archaeon]|nr:MAG: hypothetical protein EU528_04610 [Candidatus Thorarchaeota archaeon]